MTQSGTYETIVVGGGPAGSTAAALLAEKGRKVLLLEKSRFPRYHIGESLIPFCYFTLKRLGLIEKLDKSGFTVDKYSVQFVSTNGKLSQPFYFDEHLDHPCSHTWQVWRQDFDRMLLANAREKGAEVREGWQVKEVLEEGGRTVGVRAVDEAGVEHEFRAPMTIDATGRDALSVARRGWRVRDPYLNKIAVWTYYKGASRPPGKDGGATIVAFVPERGWFWWIPLAHDTVSVGVVAEKDYLFRETRDLAQVFAQEVKQNRWIEEHLAAGTPSGEFRTTGEFSYRSKYCAADGLLLAGDAFAFLDPVFSSGVFLALKGGEMAADAVDAALSAGDVSAARFAAYSEAYCHGLESMRQLVYAFYDVNFHFRDLFTKYPETRGALTDCLIGDLHRDYKPLFDKVREFASVPAPLAHGRPLIGAEGSACASPS
ncbi:MAG: tryptophan 7-halogenase [Planctomycetes bacterium]|nr:tryptophan 7-halogenase [Planctomycetota bacterium]